MLRPSDLILDKGPLPLVGTLGRSELECAAALFALVCRNRKNDVWGPVTLDEFQDETKRLAGVNNPFVTNPFLRPDFRGLVVEGFASFVGSPAQYRELHNQPLELTKKCIDRLETVTHNHRRARLTAPDVEKVLPVAPGAVGILMPDMPRSDGTYVVVVDAAIGKGVDFFEKLTVRPAGTGEAIELTRDPEGVYITAHGDEFFVPQAVG